MRDSMPTGLVKFHGARGALTVEIARTRRENLDGLSGRQRLGRNSGMLFDMRGMLGFHTVGVRFPLDMIFISDTGHVVDIKHSVPANARGPFVSADRARRAIEAAGGWAKRNGLRTGMRATIEPNVTHA